MNLVESVVRARLRSNIRGFRLMVYRPLHRRSFEPYDFR